MEKRLPPGTILFQKAETLTFDGKGRGLVQRDVAGLPYQSADPWTINQFIYLDKQPEELTLIGGFGDGFDNTGEQRFLIKFKGGIHFWGSAVDVLTGVPFDIGKWQMITLTFDGATLNIYKNGVLINTAPISLSDAAAVKALLPQ